MKTWRDAVQSGIVSGSVASLASTVALTACGKWESGAVCAPTNAISHWLWGDRAIYRDDASLRYTGIGYLIHHASSTLWAVVYEKLFGERAEGVDNIRVPLTASAAIASLACLADYKATPQRLQPGFEQRLSKRSLFLVYGAFAAGLAIRTVAAREMRRRSQGVRR